MNISFLHLSVIIFQHHIFHESLHHHAYAFNILFVLQTAYLLFSCSLMHDPCIFLYKTKTKKHENSRCILSCIYSVPWANHVGIINQFHWKTKWVNMVPNAWCHTLISSGDHPLLGCDPRLTTSRYLAPIVRQFVKFRDVPEVKREHSCTIHEIP